MLLKGANNFHFSVVKILFVQNLIFCSGTGYNELPKASLH